MTQTTNFLAHLEKVAGVGYFTAPDHAQIKPVQIPDGMELVELLTDGKVFFADADGRRSEYGKGTIFWHQAGDHTIFDTTPVAPYRCLVVRFKVSTRARPVPRVGFWRQSGRLDDFCAEAMKLFSEGAEPGLLGAYFYGTLLRQFCSISINPQENVPDALKRVLAYINNTHGRDSSIRKLCKVGYVGQAQLFRLFRNYLGITPHRYVHEKLMSYARMLLLANELSIKKTAEECGYSHIEVFYRNFLKENGMTPGEYRERQSPYPI